MKSYTRFWLSVLALSVFFAGASWGQGPLTNIMNLMGRTDSNGSLMVFGVAAGAQGPLTPIGNLRGRTYNGGDLGVTINGGTITPATGLFGNGTVALPSISFASEPSSGWYRAAAGDVRLSILGVDRITQTATGTVLTGVNLSLSSGTSFGFGSTGYITSGAAPGLFLLRNDALSTGVGWDVATDGIFKIRTRALTGDAAISASFYSSSTLSALTITTNTIAPTSSIHSIGVGLIKTITVPATCTPTCAITIIPTAAYTYDATGNITVPVGGGLAVLSKTMTFTWDGTKWNPSY